MTTFNNLQTTEPAFVSHEKSVRRSANGSHKRLNDCCFSFSNLALIVSSVLALIYSSKFLSDDSLYEFGEYLLSLRFYRQLVFIIVILPLILIVPLFNAISAFFLHDKHRSESSTLLMLVKLTYQVILAVLVLIGLVFVAPSIRYASVASQLGYELRRHMKLRYENNFSYMFLDRIQTEYECCDESWYMSNYNKDKVPLTCFVQDGAFASIYEQTCAEVIGAIVSNRCLIIAASLLVILFALVGLIVIDLLEMLLVSGRQYDVGSREARSPNFVSDVDPVGKQNENYKQSATPKWDLDEDRRDLVEELNNRLRSSERLRETPLLAQSNDSQWPQSSSTDGSRPSPILTRANYLDNKSRAQSPLLFRVDQAEAAGVTISPTPSITKGVLKRTNSSQRVDSSADDDSDDEGWRNNQDMRQVARQDLQNRRSLLNVRFAE